jgi:hypothetical protein
MTIEQAIRANSVGRLGECLEDWLKENQKPLDEPITPRELAEFFEYIENTLRKGW